MLPHALRDPGADAWCRIGRWRLVFSPKGTGEAAGLEEQLHDPDQVRQQMILGGSPRLGVEPRKQLIRQ